MDSLVNRRTMLQGLGVLPLAASSSTFSASPEGEVDESPIDFSDDTENLRAYVKLAGTTDNATVHYWYTGTIYGYTPEEIHPMVGWTGLLKMVWRNLGNGSFHFRVFDLAYFTEPGKSSRSSEFINPFTKKINRPIDIVGGPFDVVLSPKQFPWIISGDEVWVNEPKNFSFINKLHPDEWPLASSGEMLNMLYLDGFQGKLSELQDRRTSSAPSTLSIAHINPWYPFFEMGQREGCNLWHGNGKKVMNTSDISPEVLAYVEEISPGFIDSSDPWPTRTDSYKEYKEQRQPNGQSDQG